MTDDIRDRVQRFERILTGIAAAKPEGATITSDDEARAAAVVAGVERYEAAQRGARVRLPPPAVATSGAPDEPARAATPKRRRRRRAAATTATAPRPRGRPRKEPPAPAEG